MTNKYSFVSHKFYWKVIVLIDEKGAFMKKFLLICLSAMIFFTACGKSKTENVVNQNEEYPFAINDNYKNYYEIYLGGFYDTNKDGIGDLKGLIKKLDYLNDGDPKTKTDLGITGIWLMPIMPSPTYHKYDVIDYMAIDPQYGTMEDFDKLTKLCKDRGIDLIIDLVLNHTSSQHPWFESAIKSMRNDPCGQEVCTNEEKCREHNPYCNYYNFTQDSSGKGMYVVPGAGDWYYEAGFWDQMPDLNLDNPEVRAEILKIAKFWLDKGIKGFRLDATTHFFAENTTKNVEFLNWLTTELQKIKPDVYMVGEAWTDEGIIKDMYESKLPSFFNFSFSQADGTFIKSVRMGTGSTLAKDLESWQQNIRSVYPDAIDATFLSNHDNARSAGGLGRKLELEKMGAAVYLLAPGNSFIYYGEEIGMTGSGKDENKRQPLVWSIKDKAGIATPVAGSTNTDKPSAGIAEQLKDKNSLLNFYKEVIRIKDLNPEIARGTISSIDLNNEAICAYKSEYNGSTVYIIHNLSKEELDINLPDDIFNKVEIRGKLTANGGKIVLKKNNLKMPSYSTIILKEIN